MMNADDLQKLKAFVGACEANPDMLHTPQLAFFRDYLTKMGAKIPAATASFSSSTSSSESTSEDPAARAPTPPPEPESEESEVELDNSGVIEADDGEPQPMGDSDKAVSEDDMEQASEKRSQAQSAFCDGDFDSAIKLYTEAILLNPGSAMLHAKRASCYIKVQRPCAAVRDCDRAIELNPDSASAYKFRGRAHRLLGKWIEAASDLRTACKLDFDEQSDEWLKEVTPNAHKLEEHRRKHQRRQEEKELHQRQERVRKAREEHAKARKDAEEQRKKESAAGAGGGGGGGMPGGIPPGMAGLFNDPEVMAAMQDPEVMAAFADVSSNPANMAKYQNNPKIMALIAKMSTKMGGAGGFPGGMGGAGGFPGFNSQQTPKGPDMDVD